MSSTIKIIKILLVVAIIVSIFPNLVFADSPPPPPPPPPCTIRSAGCYKEGNVKAGFGELSSTTFAYFLTESKCIRAGGCDCRGTPDDVKEETNPDDSNGACNCIAGAGWNAKAKCCGDDESDCGRISTGVLCSIDANREAASWISSSQSLGDIRYVGCDGTESLSDGTTWHKCDGQFWKRTISGNEYICIGRGRESIVECCGDGSCKSRIDGKRLSTGHSVSPANQQNEASTINLASNPVGLCTLLNIDDNPECGLESTNPACVCIPSSTKKESFQECVDVPDTTINQGGFSGESAGGVVAADSLITGAATECTTKYKCVSSQPIQCGGPPEILCPAGYFCKFDTNQITGNAVSSGYSKTYYCTPARKFVTDLDVDQLGVSTSDRQSTCGKAGFTWTGTKCCSEADDIGEYYNDADGVGGCWNKKPILSVNFVEGTDNSVVNFNGEFNGCAIERTNFNTNNDNL
ncbi:hypothetical protein HYY70_06435, partial [Candidatus Woesearchaeota archaeon]|nr:hypothetical protein [Candidatus Woesearchaeota archaeon]